MIKAAFAIDENILKTELNSKGNKSMKLESLADLMALNLQVHTLHYLIQS